jgi:hypothetical protein
VKDDKRLLRKIKRDLKRTGNRKRRQYLKDVEAEPNDFDFGRNSSEGMNEPRKPRDRE